MQLNLPTPVLVIIGIILLIILLKYIFSPLKIWSIDRKLDRIIELLERR